LRATEAKDSGAALDGRSDIFSLGVILYELATGTHPFGPAPLKLTSADLRRHLLERQKAGPVEARRLNPDVDAAFSRLIQRCLAVDPQDRPQSAAEVASALRGALAPLPRTKRLLARNPRKTLAVAIFLLAIGLGSIAFALARAPHSERQFDAGLRLYREGQYGQAVQHFNEVLQDDPHNHEARFVRARAHQQMGIEDKDRYNLAIQDYLEADRRNPDGRCKAALGYCLNRTSGRSEVAIEYYKQAIRLGFAPAETYNNLGFSYMLLGKLDDARHNLNLAIEVDSKLQAPYHNRARLAINQAQQINLRLEVRTTESEFYRILLSGIADAQKAIDLGPASAELYFDSARLRAMAARVDQKWIEPAMQHLEESLKVGCDPRKCNDATLQQLQTHPRFADLANRPAGRPFPPTRRLVDPIHDRAQ
jgi:tetratricopeptide (TPR) repeat protein